MYKPETVLRLREQREPEKDREGNEIPFPYNRVRVVAQSPISHPGNAEWSGVGAQGVIIQPLDGFAANIDEPYGKIQSLYEVESVPEDVIPATPQVRVTTPMGGDSPEDIFAREAPGTPPEPGQIRARSPLGDEVKDAPSASPLDKPKRGGRRA